MWQVDFFMAVEREHERRRELERRRALRDAARLDAPAGARTSPLRRILGSGRERVAAIASGIASELDRPAIGPHHL